MTLPEPNYLDLDGSTLEGGGQLLRNAVALAALTHTPVRITNVRQGRPQPGLKAQHAAGLDLVTQITNARATGIHKGSHTVSFDPSVGRIRRGDYEADPGTAGATSLLFQVSLPCLLFPESDLEDQEDERVSRLTLRGGTNATNAPPIDYAQHVLLPFLTTHLLPLPSSSSSSQSQSLTLTTKQRGFFPRGGGLVHARILPLPLHTPLRPITLTHRGVVTRLRAIIYASGKNAPKIVEEIRSGAARELVSFPELIDIPLELELETETKGKQGSSSGSGILLIAYTNTNCTLSGSSLHTPRLPPSTIGCTAARELIAHLASGACVDSWLQDQMIVFLALAKGRSTVCVGRGDLTLHARTAMWVAERLTGARFEVGEGEGEEGMKEIRCEGIGLEGRF